MGVKHVIPCANGTDALQIAMMGLDLKHGDEVITADFTFAATVEVIALLQLTPVLVDVDMNNMNISLDGIRKAITSKTKAIVPVHLFGRAANMDAIMEIAKEHNLYVIEDNAQAIGAKYTFKDGTLKSTGTIGHIGTTSFFPSKNLGCYGDGGAMFTNDDKIAKNLKMIANHGQQVKYYHKVTGCNSRLDSIQAAILNIKLNHLDSYSFSRNKMAKNYDENFSDIQELSIPKRQQNSTHVFHQYTLKIVPELRNALIKFLKENKAMKEFISEKNTQIKSLEVQLNFKNNELMSLRNKNEAFIQSQKKAKSYISQSVDTYKKEINYLEKLLKEKQDLINGMTMKYENKKYHRLFRGNSSITFAREL